MNGLYTVVLALVSTMELGSLTEATIWVTYYWELEGA
jgi:hypothetical protein